MGRSFFFLFLLLSVIIGMHENKRVRKYGSIFGLLAIKTTFIYIDELSFFAAVMISLLVVVWIVNISRNLKAMIFDVIRAERFYKRQRKAGCSIKESILLMFFKILDIINYR